MKANQLYIYGGLAALLALLTRPGQKAASALAGALAGYGLDGALTVQQVRALADQTVGNFFPGIDPRMLVAMAWIESSFRPTAFRIEITIQDASIGLMQTLGGTARWLWDIGYKGFGERPSDLALADPAVSMYFGAAYVDYLMKYRGGGHSEEWIVRAYNGGPGGATSAATLNHWRKYQEARARYG